MKIIDFLKPFIEKIRGKRNLILSLSVMVVFITTYLLILPAFTLEKDEAMRQGGIDIPAGAVGTEVQDEEETAEEQAAYEDNDVTNDPSDVSVETDQSESVEITYDDVDSDDGISEDFGDPLKYEGEKYNISVVDRDGVLPDGTEIHVEEIDKKENAREYKTYYDNALAAVQEETGGESVADLDFARFYDISLVSDGQEIEPADGDKVGVRIEYEKELRKSLNIEDEKKFRIIHFTTNEDTGELEAEVLDNKENKISIDTDNNDQLEKAEFEADSFSVYAIVYTVDFHWEVDGNEYDFSIPGGGYLSLESIIEALNIAKPDNEANEKNDSGSSDVLTPDDVGISDETKQFVANIENVEFSDPSLAWIGKVDEDCTVGGLKKTNGLEVEYSAELTEQQKAEINAQTVEAGDWAFISLHPFDTEESLNVTMKNGDVFTIRVTDAKDPLGLDGQRFVVVYNSNTALSPVVKVVNDRNFLNYANINSGSDLSWTFEYDAGAFIIDDERRGGYYISHNGNYIKMTGTSASDPDRSVTLTNNKEEATLFYIEYDSAAGKYRFSNDGEGKSGILTFLNNSYFGVSNNISSNAAWMELRSPTQPSIPGYVSPWNILDDNIKVKLYDYSGTLTNYHWNSNGEYTNDINKNWAQSNKGEYRQGWGVNNNRTLLFSGSGFSDGSDPYNYYTGGDDAHPEVMQGIVKNKLENGYPVLSNSATGAGASLGYLFGAGGQNGVTAYEGVDGNGLKGLLRRNSEGYYYYSSEQNYATLNDAQDEILIYSESYNKDKGSENAQKIGFFPFDPYRAGQSKAGEEKGPNGSPYNHQFGMTLETEFVYPPDGKLPSGEDMVFDFSGDDDVWVFVDDVLVLDLGGVHQPLGGVINFADLNSTITNATASNVSGQHNLPTTKTFEQLFNGTGKTFNTQAYSTHTLKFFYLERGGCDSNCNLSFNLMTGRPLSMSKKLYGLTDSEREKYKDEPFTFEVLVNNELYNGNSTVRFNAAGEIIDKDFPIVNGQVPMKDGETVTITGFKNSAVFSVAEVNAFSSDTFEKPYAERYYLDENYVRHEEEIESGDLSYVDTALPDDDLKEWRTPDYELKNTEQVTFSNTLKEKDIEVEKIWNDDVDHSDDSITFKVGAKAYGENEAPTDYLVDALKKTESSTSNDKEFVLNNANGWKTTIENLPLVTPLVDRERRIIYSIEECQVNGYSSLVREIDSDQWNIDAVKFWPEDDPEREDVISVKLKRNSDGLFYNGVDEDGTAAFTENGTVYSLTKDNDYTYRFHHVPKNQITDTPDMASDQYSLVEVTSDDSTPQGLVMFAREIIRFKITNTPVQETDPDFPDPVVELHKRIDALRDGALNPDSSHSGEDLTDLYRLYLDYKVNTLQVPEGVDLLFLIDHSGSMNYDSHGGNKNRALSVMQAINGSDGVISNFLRANDNNQWAAIGFKGPDEMNYWKWGLIPNWSPGPWDGYQQEQAGINDSEILSSTISSGNDSFGRQTANISLSPEGSDVLTDYTAGFWRAEQFLKQNSVKEDGRKKVLIFISDGIPTLHIPSDGESIENAGNALGSYYYPDWDGGCTQDTETEFGYFVKDVTEKYGYTFGDNLELYTIALGNQMMPQERESSSIGENLLKNMLETAYGEEANSNYISIADSQSAATKLNTVLSSIIGTNEVYNNFVIKDDLSKYVDLYGLANAGDDENEILRAAKCKVTMTDPSDLTNTKTLYEEGALVAENNRTSENVQILDSVSYDPETKTVTATFNPDYEAQSGLTYTLSFDVKATETAYQTYAETGYDKDLEGVALKGDPDTDFLGTDPENATSVGKDGFRSNDSALLSCRHNDSPEDRTYPHPVIQVSLRIFLEKITQEGTPLEGATFQLYSDGYDPEKTDEENAEFIIGSPMTSTDVDGRAVIYRDGLDPGTYYLVETDAPEGYIALEGPVKIEIGETDDGNMEVNASINCEAINYPFLSLDREKGEWNIKITNSTGASLPYAGGIGTTVFYVIGSILLLGSTIVLIARRRIRNV